VGQAGWGRSCARRGILVAVLAGVLVAGCGSESAIRGTAEPRRMDLAVGVPGRSLLPTAAAPGPMAAGSYYTSQFRAPFRFEVPECCTLDNESAGVVFMHGGEFPDASELYVVAPRHAPLRVADPPIVQDEEYLPLEYFPRSRGGEVVRGSVRPLGPFPGDYLEYLAASPYLEAGPIQPADLFGLPGRALDVVVSRTPAEGSCNGFVGYCFSLFVYGRNGLSEQIEPRGAVMRVWELDRAGERVMVILAAPSQARFDEAAAALAALAPTVEFL